ncbi:zinc finger protein 493-like isoform X2 [Paramacrobiotus metropolitanus]|uniref:zinc finger protein 493-like isoform X2 n=1 Tax=Paramacrobiotus metropolitanus TaxID=2943436 RepID=UPI002445FE61|nr:zinc finger protein 493-like isoform X2 [Paramacrobiotus metropolitanus]
MGSVTSIKPAECAFACGNAENEELRYFQLDSDHTSNWMKHVRFADNPQECNVAVFEVPQSVPFWQSSNGSSSLGMVIFVTLRRILPNEELKVAYSWEYASRIGRGYLGNTTTGNASNAANTVDAAISSGLPADGADTDNLAASFINFDVSLTANVLLDFPSIVSDRRDDGGSECTDDEFVSDSEVVNDFVSLDEKFVVSANEEDTETGVNTFRYTEDSDVMAATLVDHRDNDGTMSEKPVRQLDDGSNLPLTENPEPDSGEIMDSNQESLKTREHLLSRKYGKCLVCGQNFRDLISHLNTTHTEEDVRAVNDACFVCHRKFRSPKLLATHLKRVHRRISPPDEAARLAALDYIRRTGFLHYRCAICRKVFTSEALLNVHAFAHDTDRSRHEEQPERKCPACAFTASTFAELLEHIGLHARTLRKLNQCILCGVPVDHVQKHAKSRHPEVLHMVQEKCPFECSECSQTCISIGALKCHMNLSHQRTRCSYCGFRSPNMKTLINHAKEHCVDGLFSCQWCTTSYKEYAALAVHIQESHSDAQDQFAAEHAETAGTDLVAADALESATLTEFIAHMKETTTFSYYCTSCRLHFPIKVLFDLHQIHHSVDKAELDQRPERRCPACDFEGGCFGDLVHHTKEHGLSATDKKPCAVCGEHFQHLKRHFRARHPDIMKRLEESWKFGCEECGERFKSENNRAIHMKRDLGLHVRPEHSVNGEFPCPSCGIKFLKYPLVRLHYREYHDVTQIKTCDVCQHVCRGSKQLAEHMEDVHDVQTGGR